MMHASDDVVGPLEEKDWVVTAVENQGVTIWVKHANDPKTYLGHNSGDPWNDTPGFAYICVFNEHDELITRRLAPGDQIELTPVQDYQLREGDDVQMQNAGQREEFAEWIRFAKTLHGTFYCVLC
jgi:hypothetical protein